jgi:hypothetical protein
MGGQRTVVPPRGTLLTLVQTLAGRVTLLQDLADHDTLSPG